MPGTTHKHNARAQTSFHDGLAKSWRSRSRMRFLPAPKGDQTGRCWLAATRSRAALDQARRIRTPIFSGVGYASHRGSPPVRKLLRIDKCFVKFGRGRVDSDLVPHFSSHRRNILQSNFGEFLALELSFLCLRFGPHADVRLSATAPLWRVPPSGENRSLPLARQGLIFFPG